MQRITQFDGLYGQADAQSTADYLFSELLETRSRHFDWVIPPHLHARLYQIFLVEKGQVVLQEATRRRDLSAPVVLLIPPTALHGLTYSADATGRILTLSDALVEGLLPTTDALTPLLEAVQCLTAFEPPYPVSRVRALLEEIDQEVFDNQPEKRAMLHACLQRLLLVLLRLWQRGEALAAQPNTPALQYFRRFQQRVRQVGTTHGVAQLADELAITPVHLNRICRTVAGKSAHQLLQAHVLDEARHYLRYTTYSVAEIAYQLHFEYPNYFAKFFKKHTGQSPTEFRENLPPTV